MSAAPEQEPLEVAIRPERADRDDKGRFLPGHSLPGPGRLPGVDAVRAAREACKRHGTTLEEELAEVLWKLMSRAKQGDIAAAREVLSRTCADMKMKLTNDGRIEVTVSTGVPSHEDEDEAVRELLS